MTEAKKNDQEKSRLDLIPYDVLEQLGYILGHGAKKYGAYNWQFDGGLDWNRTYAALQRHLGAWSQGNDIDPDSGFSHLTCALANITFLLHYNLNSKEFPKDYRKAKTVEKPVYRVPACQCADCARRVTRLVHSGKIDPS